MKLRSWNLGMVIVTIALFCPTALASDGIPSRDTLADMGLSGLTIVSDDDALAIRGQGFKGSSVRVFGNSFATINTKYGGAHSENGYVNSGKHFAAGGNYSKAGVTIITSKGKNYGGGYGKPPGYGGMGGGHTTIKTVKVFAGGSSWGVAF